MVITLVISNLRNYSYRKLLFLVHKKCTPKKDNFAHLLIFVHLWKENYSSTLH